MTTPPFGWIPERWQQPAFVMLAELMIRLRFPFLDDAFIARDATDLRLFQGTMHPERHDLFFLGVSRPMGAIWPMAEVHARFAGALLSGRYALPGQREIDRRSTNILTRPFNSPGLLGASARAELARGARRVARGAAA